MESAMYGNATYIFEGDWSFVSQLTKKQILEGNLHKARLIHQSGWESQLKLVLASINIKSA
jgi:hypothetical protein